MSSLKFLEKKIDLGDFLGVEGYLFHTHKGELTLFAHKVKILCKSLLPLPDKHSGLADKGVRYRKRWLDLITNPDVVHTFIMRSRVLELTRKYFHRLGFMEVETPVLQNTYEGASAKPFLTHLQKIQKDLTKKLTNNCEILPLIARGHAKIKDMFRYQFLIKAKKLIPILPQLHQIPQHKEIKLSIDVDPLSTFF